MGRGEEIYADMFFVLDDERPTPHTDGQMLRGSAPPMLPTPTSPKKTGGCEYR
jgi:hypothetical protein